MHLIVTLYRAKISIIIKNTWQDLFRFRSHTGNGIPLKYVNVLMRIKNVNVSAQCWQLDTIYSKIA